MKKDFREAPLDSQDRAILEFSVKLTRHPNRMASADLDSLRAQGLQDEAILEVVHIVSFFNYINRVADALNVDSEPEWSE